MRHTQESGIPCVLTAQKEPGTKDTHPPYHGQTHTSETLPANSLAGANKVWVVRLIVVGSSPSV